MSSSGLQSLLAFLKNRYKGVLVVSVGVITFSLVLSFRNAKRIKKIEKSVRELTEKSMSKEELEFECQKLRQRTVANQTYTVEELESSVFSLKNLAKLSEKLLDYTAYKKILSKEAHLNFKQDLTRTTLAARRLSSILGGFLDPNFKKMFLRVLSEGNWEKAKVYAKRKALKNPQKSGEQQKKPWVVLVTGLNGIRKTSSINSSWFQQVLFEALEDQLGGSGITQDCLPDGSNSFFRHLDHILSTVTNEEFRKLYNISDVEIYAKLKNALFMRYRTLAEIFGVMFIEEAVRKNMNVYLETSGRDTSMIEYVNHFFPDGKYNKCLVHFTINDVKFAQQSVDKRMMYEMKKGSEALKGSRGIDRVVGVIEANSGGPFGSVHLAEIQRASEVLHRNIFQGSTPVPAVKDWYKAEIKVEGKDDAPWTVVANVKNCTEFTFLSSIVFEGGRADVRREVKF